jgi:hypothetical protein
VSFLIPLLYYAFMRFYATYDPMPITQKTPPTEWLGGLFITIYAYAFSLLHKDF